MKSILGGSRERMRVRPRVAPVVALVVALVAAPARAGEVEEMTSELNTIRSRANAVRANSIKPTEVQSLRASAEAEFKKAQRMFRENDFSAARIKLDVLLIDLASDRPAWYGEAIYMLAESLYRLGSTVLAVDYFEKLLAASPTPEQAAAARLRIVEGATALNELDRARKNLDIVLERGVTPDTERLRHGLGLGYLRKGRAAEAEALLGAAAPGAWQGRCAYLAGVALTAQAAKAGDAQSAAKLLDRAKERFAAAANAPGTEEDDKLLRDVARLAVARLAMQRAKAAGLDATKRDALYAEAAVEYDKIGNDSPLYAQALFEGISVVLRSGNVDRAQKTIEDILKKLKDDSPALPAALLALAQIYKQRAAQNPELYEAAERRFREVVERFANVFKAVDEQIRASAGKSAIEIYNDVLGPRTLLPQSAYRQLQERAEVARAVRTIQTLEEDVKGVDELKAKLDVLQAALRRGSPVDVFPEFRKAADETRDLRAALTDVQRRLTEAGDRIVGRTRDPAALAELRSAREETARRRDAYERLPRGSEERGRENFKVLRRLDDLAYGLTQFENEQQELEQRLTEAQSGRERLLRARVDDEYRKRVEEEFLTERAEVAAIGNEVNKLRGEIEVLRGEVQVGASLNAAFERSRSEYDVALQRERAVQARIAATLDPASRAEYDRLAPVLQLAAETEQAIDAVQSDLNAVVADFFTGYEKQLNEERSEVAAQQTALDQLNRTLGGFAVEVIQQNLAAVRDQFSDYVQQADLGLVDIQWTRLTRAREEIERLSVERAAENQRIETTTKEADDGR